MYRSHRSGRWMAALALALSGLPAAAIGLNRAVAAGSALKFEWMRTHIGAGSSMADALPGTPPPRDTNVNVRSIVFSSSF